MGPAKHGGKRSGAGRPIVEGEKLDRITVRLPISRIKKECDATGISMSEFVRQAIEAFLKNYK